MGLITLPTSLQQQPEDMPRHVLESLVRTAYQARVLTIEQGRRLPRSATRFEVRGFFNNAIQSKALKTTWPLSTSLVHNARRRG